MLKDKIEKKILKLKNLPKFFLKKNEIKRNGIKSERRKKLEGEIERKK